MTSRIIIEWSHSLKVTDESETITAAESECIGETIADGESETMRSCVTVPDLIASHFLQL
jgi:hypothetical protein